MVDIRIAVMLWRVVIYGIIPVYFFLANRVIDGPLNKHIYEPLFKIIPGCVNDILGFSAGKTIPPGT